MTPARRLRERIATATACVLAVLVALGAPGSAMPTNPDVRVSTFAGSGVPGFADGDATHASFVMPFGLAYAPDGTLYVSDAGAQRIRAVAPSGAVRTIAGGGDLTAKGLWVAGGYRDGAGGEARFNRPAGIAWHDGALYVADSYNHCIRKVLPSGVVTTFAGSPQRPGNEDGDRAHASFAKPVGLAFDSAGILYVADPVSGLRTIAPDGQVSRIGPLGAGTPYGVAAVDGPHGVDLFVADLLGLVRWGPDHVVERFATPDAWGRGTHQMEGLEPLGYPFAVAAFDADTVAYTDVRGSSIRYLDWDAGAPQVLAGLDVFDGISTGAGYRDGPGDEARVDEPMGIAIGPSGTIVVADSGSRRIRMISNLDRTHDVRRVEGLEALPTPNPQEYRIAFFGSSNPWNFVRWSDSIPGILERALAGDLRGTSRTLRVLPFALPGSGIPAQASYIDVMLSETRAADVIVVDLNPVTLTFMTKNVDGAGVRPGDASHWTKELTADLILLQAQVRRHGSTLVVSSTPISEDLSPAEDAWNALVSSQSAGQVTPAAEVGDLMNAAIRASGVPYLDLWPVFQAESRSPEHAALFGTQDDHLSAHGRRVVAEALTAFLRKLKPWAKPEGASR